MYGYCPIWKFSARKPVIACHQSAEPPCAARVFSHPKIDEGKIISELAKMIGITPAWLMRSGR